MKDLASALALFAALTAVCGGVYPAAVTLVARGVFPRQAAGSFVRDAGGRVIGSALVGQPFSDPKYFWPRPSATRPFAYNPGASGGANLGPTNPALLAAVADRLGALRASGVAAPLPADLVLASASGLDPHVTPAGARCQVARVAGARGMRAEQVERLLAACVEDRQLAVLGEPRVNVLLLNLALDAHAAAEKAPQ